MEKLIAQFSGATYFQAATKLSTPIMKHTQLSGLAHHTYSLKTNTSGFYLSNRP